MKNKIKNRPWLATAVLTVILAAGGFVGVKAATAAEQHERANVQVAQYSESSRARGYSAVVKRVVPAVVNISSSKVAKQDTRGLDRMKNDPFFRQFFGDDLFRQIPKNRREKSLGSGVLVSPEGYILTSSHVVEGATNVDVTLHDKREFKAKVIGNDARTDIAVLKITDVVPGAKFPTLTLADSSKVEVGDVVLAI